MHHLIFVNSLQTAEQDRHLTQTNMKIDTEVAGLKTMLESHKLDTIKYLAGRSCRTIFDSFISEKVMCLLDSSNIKAVKTVLKHISLLETANPVELKLTGDFIHLF